MVERSAQGRGHAAAAVTEAVGALASPAVRDRILERACELAEVKAVPDDPGRLRGFVEVHLSDAVEQILGPGSGALVVDSLRPIVDRAASTAPPPPLALPLPELVPPGGGRRRLSSVEIPAALLHEERPPPRVHEPDTSPPYGLEMEPEIFDLPLLPPHHAPGPLDEGIELAPPSPPPQARPSAPPRAPGRPGSRVPTLQGVAVPLPAALAAPARVILFATSDPTEVADLEEALAARPGGGHEVLHVSDSLELLEAVQGLPPGAGAPVLVVSGRSPSVTPVTIAAMAPELPAGFHVVIWGRSPEADAASQAPQGSRLAWTRFDSMAPASDVASTCLELLRTSAA